MLRTGLAIFLIAGASAWGQGQSDAGGATNNADKASADKTAVDKASAYYHYAVAHLYTQMATASGGHNSEYVNLAINHYQAAIKADPETALLREELSDVQSGRLWLPFFQYRRRPTAK
jgi:hypothetical protein